MAAKIKKEAGSPKFQQLREILKTEIQRLSEGDRFYTQHEAMKKFKVSCATVTRAMAELAEAGYLTRKTGGGTFVMSRSPVCAIAESDGKELLLALVSGTASMLKNADPLNWFVRDGIQRGVIHNWRGGCRIIEEAELAGNPKIYSAAILINPSEGAMEFLSSRQDIDYVIVNQAQKIGMSVNAVNVSHMTGVYEAVAYLAKELGHKKIAIITAESASHSERLAAFQIGLRTFKLPLPDEYLVRAAGGSFEDGEEAMRRLLSLKDPPTAVFADTDIKAAGAISAAAEAGLNVPSDISVIGFDDIPEAKSLRPPLTTVGGMYFAMGAAAVKVLEAKCEKKLQNVPSALINTKLVIRKSCQKLPPEQL